MTEIIILQKLRGVSCNCLWSVNELPNDLILPILSSLQHCKHRAIEDSSRQRLIWNKPPRSVLVIKKIRDTSVIPPFLDLIRWLIYEKQMIVYVEPAVFEDLALVRADQSVLSLLEKLVTFRGNISDHNVVDLIICLGGDGTLLYASSLFQGNVPPVMAFHLGSLGFLTPFEFHNYQEPVTHVLDGKASLTLRSRLRCLITKKNTDYRLVPGVAISRNLINGQTDGGGKNVSCHLVLNEVVVDRGPHPYLSNIELFIDGKYITTVQGDGLIVSTPTGSTAYAVAAGASMIHPSVPAIMVTPICPHSLSFRPIVVPAGVELKICVADDSRNSAWVSFDGRKRQELLLGDCLRVTTSIYPVPSICSEDQISDWFDSLAECLHWNVRKKQRQFDDLPDFDIRTTSTGSSVPSGTTVGGGGGISSLEEHESSPVLMDTSSISNDCGVGYNGSSVAHSTSSLTSSISSQRSSSGRSSS